MGGKFGGGWGAGGTAISGPGSIFLHSQIPLTPKADSGAGCESQGETPPADAAGVDAAGGGKQL